MASAEPVTKVARERRHECVTPEKERAERSEADVSKSQFGSEQGEDRCNRGPVREVDRADYKQRGHQHPPVETRCLVVKTIWDGNDFQVVTIVGEPYGVKNRATSDLSRMTDSGMRSHIAHVAYHRAAAK